MKVTGAYKKRLVTFLYIVTYKSKIFSFSVIFCNRSLYGYAIEVAAAAWCITALCALPYHQMKEV